MSHKVLISNNLHDYIYGDEKGYHCDGLIFTDVTDDEVKWLQSIAENHNKEIKVLLNFYDDVPLTLDSTTPSTDSIEDPKVEEITSSKRKVKKVFVYNSNGAKKILPSELNEYLNNGYKLGRGKNK